MKNNKQLIKKMRYEEAIRRNNMARKGYFDNPTTIRTTNIEQEVQILDSNIEMVGEPISAEEFFKNNSIQARPDTSTFIVEYDGSNQPVEINHGGLKKLEESFSKRTRYIQDKISKDGILVPIGANPVLKASASETWLVKDESKYRRYLSIDANAYTENPNKKTNIINPLGRTIIRERASSIKGMFRVTGTQFHISEKNIKDALDSHRTSIAIAPFMVLAFGNSPFLAGFDTGRSSSRMELLCQTEQLRSGLPKPADSLLEYYNDILSFESPFEYVDDPSINLDNALSAIHTVSRIRVTMNKNNGIIRNEFRHIDSQSPYKAMQAFLLTLGLVEAFRYSDERPLYKYSQIDFQNAVWGFKDPMHWNNIVMSAQELGLYLTEKSRNFLKRMGLEIMVHKYLDPFKEELKIGMTQSDMIRKSFYCSLKKGASFKQSLLEVLKQLNHAAIKKR